MDEAVSQGLPWTGERYVPSVTGLIELEHMHRYLLAQRLAFGRDVLDLASGEGYGAAMLAEVAKSVVGVDASDEVIAHSKATYSTANLQYRLGSCAAIPLDDASIDLVVSFETIEHHDQHEAMMREIKRVLRPGGVLIISSPDKYEYSIVPQLTNPYHVKELYREEFEQLLSGHFRNVSHMGQRVVSGSAIFHRDVQAPIVSYRRENERFLCQPGIARPVYLVAVASDGQLPAVPSAFLLQAFDETEPGLDLQFAALSARLFRTSAERDALASECAAAKEALARVHDSTSWRLTLPLRWLRGFIANPRREVGWLARSLYRACPLPMALKLRWKAKIFLRFGPMLGGFQSYRSWVDFERSKRDGYSAASSDGDGGST